MSKRKIFLKILIFQSPSIMGVLNLPLIVFQTEENLITITKAFKQILNMIKSGANIIDVGGESTRPGSKTIDPKIEWKRIKVCFK